MAAEARPDVGVLFMAYGTPASADDVERYYTHIRRGRPPAAEQLADLQRRYDAIGGVSPLLARTRAQVAGTAAALGEGFVCELGQKHAAPFIEDAVSALLTRGVTSIVGIVLAPHFSALSVGEYHARASEAVSGRAVYTGVDSWHVEPALIDLLAGRVRRGLDRFPADARVRTLVTAHSLPSRVLDMGDPYPTQLQETAEAVMTAAGVDASDWQLAWQSAGRTPEPWLGPDILDVIRSFADERSERLDGVLVCPAGFTSDHLEVLYDVDVEARRVADEVGLRLERTESLNDDPALCELLAHVIKGAVIS
ncbi:MAG: protoporphyrin/coproporphyrin ferrochelatase [Acidimicrobiaceae bacterium]|nr:protoporphyrin/coproporphyrin ferrochelatase [Acidimicrobiaceae bacterium]